MGDVGRAEGAKERAEAASPGLPSCCGLGAVQMLPLPLPGRSQGRVGPSIPDSCLWGRAGTPQQHLPHTSLPSGLNFPELLKDRVPGFTNETEARSGYVGPCNNLLPKETRFSPSPGVGASSSHTTRAWHSHCSCISCSATIRHSAPWASYSGRAGRLGRPWLSRLALKAGWQGAWGHLTALLSCCRYLLL